MKNIYLKQKNNPFHFQVLEIGSVGKASFERGNATFFVHAEKVWYLRISTS